LLDDPYETRIIFFSVWQRPEWVTPPISTEMDFRGGIVGLTMVFFMVSSFW
jgi:hypothetical protein